MKINAAQLIFNNFKRYEELEEEIYGFVIVEPKSKVRKWDKGELNNTWLDINNIVHRVFNQHREAIKSKKLSSLHAPYVLSQDLKLKSGQSLLDQSLKRNIENVKETVFSESIEWILKEVTKREYPMSEVFLVLHAFSTIPSNKLSSTKVYQMSEAAKLIMATGSLEENAFVGLPI